MLSGLNLEVVLLTIFVFSSGITTLVLHFILRLKVDEGNTSNSFPLGIKNILIMVFIGGSIISLVAYIVLLHWVKISVVDFAVWVGILIISVNVGYLKFNRKESLPTIVEQSLEGTISLVMLFVAWFMLIRSLFLL